MDSSTAAHSWYLGRNLEGFLVYLQRSEEHKTIQKFLDKILPDEFARIGDGKSGLNFLGIGSGGGEMDVHMIAILQSKLRQGTNISIDVVEPSNDLTENFKALVAKSPDLQKIQFSWNTLTSEKYEEKLKNSKEMKKFDFIHMIQVLNHVTDCLETIKFFHSLLAERGKLLIIHGAVNCGFHILWKTFQQELCKKSISEYFSAGEVKRHLEKLGLKYEEHIINNTLDITECFMEEDKTGELLLDFLTDLDHFHQSLTADLRASILNVLRNKCSTEKNGRILFDTSVSAFLVYA